MADMLLDMYNDNATTTDKAQDDGDKTKLQTGS